MKFSVRNIYLIVLHVIIISGIVKPQSGEIKDIIAPLKLLAGRTDTVLVSDLFYSGDYNISFRNDKNIRVKYERKFNRLIVTPSKTFEGFTNLYFEKQKEVYTIPVFVKKIGIQKFSFRPEKKYRSIFLFGSFNNWNRQQIPMISPKRDGIYRADVPLEPGRYEYKFFADGGELLDPANKNTVPNGIGGINSVLNVPDPHLKKIFLHKKNFKPGKASGVFQFYIENEEQGKFSSTDAAVILDNKKLPGEYLSINKNLLSISIPNSELSKSKILRVIVFGKGASSNLQVVPLSGGKPCGNDSFSWYDGIIYSLMIDRFNDGNTKINSPVVNDSVSPKANYMGGDFEGVTQKIEEGYFTSLGINTLWISPVNDNPDSAFQEFPAPHRWYTGYHGYWPISQNKVEEKFGTLNDLKKLINTAHKHGIKVLLDFVSHHIHKDHPYFKEHKNWFGKLELPDGRLNLRLWDEYRLTTWFEPYLPSFDFIDSNEAADTISGNAVWWLQTTGADGFRHDAVKHVPNKFWRTLTGKLKREIEAPTGKQVYQIGETFGNYDLVSSYVNNGQLSSQFNFELYNTAQAVLIDPARSFKDLDAEMKKTIGVYGPLNLMGNIMDSHDKNRFMAYADGAIDLSQWSAIEEGWKNPPEVHNPYSYKKAELYLAYMLTIPGLPVIYYGSEFGMTGLSDPDNRRMMRFGDRLSIDEKKMLEVVTGIVKMRSEHSALRYGDFLTLRADDNFYAYIRSDFNERILVVLNKSDEKQKFEIALPEIYSVRKTVNLETGASNECKDRELKVELNPRGWTFLKLE
jgi:glycosidase